MIAWIVSTDLTEFTIDHLMSCSAMLYSTGYRSWSLGRFETAQPRAQMVAKRVNDDEYTDVAVCITGSSKPTKGLRIRIKLSGGWQCLSAAAGSQH